MMWAEKKGQLFFFFLNISQNALRTHQVNFPFFFSTNCICYNKVKSFHKRVVYVFLAMFCHPPPQHFSDSISTNISTYVKTLVVMQRAKLTALKINHPLTREMNLKHQMHVLECCCALNSILLCNAVVLCEGN